MALYEKSARCLDFLVYYNFLIFIQITCHQKKIVRALKQDINMFWLFSAAGAESLDKLLIFVQQWTQIEAMWRQDEGSGVTCCSLTSRAKASLFIAHQRNVAAGHTHTHTPSRRSVLIKADHLYGKTIINYQMCHFLHLSLRKQLNL